MRKLGVPLVDAFKIVEGQKWATTVNDGRHYHPIVPMEIIEFLRVLTTPTPPRLYRADEIEEELRLETTSDSHDGPALHSLSIDCHHK